MEETKSPSSSSSSLQFAVPSNTKRASVQLIDEKYMKYSRLNKCVDVVPMRNPVTVKQVSEAKHYLGQWKKYLPLLGEYISITKTPTYVHLYNTICDILSFSIYNPHIPYEHIMGIVQSVTQIHQYWSYINGLENQHYILIDALIKRDTQIYHMQQHIDYLQSVLFTGNFAPSHSGQPDNANVPDCGNIPAEHVIDLSKDDQNPISDQQSHTQNAV